MLVGVGLPSAAGANAAGGPGVRYLVTPLVNRSGSAGLGWMSTALASIVAEKLEAHPALQPAYGPQILLGLPPLDSEGGAEVLRQARERGAQLVVSGHFDRIHWRYQVGLRMDAVEARGLRLLARAEATAATAAAGTAGILDLLDEALFRLLDQAGLTPPSDRRAALARRPTRDAYALTLYGRALGAYYQAMQAGPPDRAELERVQKTLLRVCFIDPRFAEAHRMLGVVNEALGESGRAMGQYAYALDLRPDYFAALTAMARLQRQAGQRARAQETLEKALAVRPWDVDTRFALGEVLWEAGRLPEAQVELSRVIQASPEHLPARRVMAQVHAALGQSEEFAAELLRILALAPDDIEVRMDLGAAYQRLGRLRQAIAVYEEVTRRRPRHAQAWRLLGDLFRRVQEPERAVAAYQKLLRLEPDEPRAYFLLGVAYAEAGMDAKAEQVLQDAQQFRRYLGEAWSNLGALALRRGDLVRAAWYLSRAAARPGARPLARYNYALVLDRMNQPERALAELRAAVEQDPHDADLWFALGVVMLRVGRSDEAQRAFAEAVRLQPDHAHARHNLDLLKEKEKERG